MKSTEHWLVHEHTQYEALIREIRLAVETFNWWSLEQNFEKLVEQLHYHMAQEEEILFPAYDAKKEPSSMSTLELYNEHSIIVFTLRKLEDLIKSREAEDVHKCVVDLERLMLEHNEKEEKAFLPFASHLLFNDRDELALKLKNFVMPDVSRNWGIGREN